MNDRPLMGATWTSRADGGGRFHCPRCRVERDCTRTVVLRRLTFLGRPVGRLGRGEVFRTCAVCGHAFAAAPDRPPQGEDHDDRVLAEDDRALLGVLAAVVFSDSAVRSAEKRVVAGVLQRYTPHLHGLDVDDLLRGARQRWGDPIARLERLRGLVDERIRRAIVEAAYHVCTADGELHPEEGRLLDRIGAALDLAPPAVRRALIAARRQPVSSMRQTAR